MKDKMQIWKDVPGYDGSYQINNFGDVKTLSDRQGIERLMKPSLNADGYLIVRLTKDGKTKTCRIHQLIAMAFLGHKPDGTMNVVVNHIDNNRLNNNISNLELVSHRYNVTCHRTDLGINWDKGRSKWLVFISINTKRINLGRFSDKQDALDMYQKALNNMHLYNGDNNAFRNALKQL
jgi:hypothetical protein